MPANKFKPSKLSPWLELAKFRISFAVALSALAGYFVYGNLHGWIFLWLLAGTTLLASGVAVLNQVQERDVDAIMPRTKHRPIPMGLVSPEKALIYAFALLVLGIVVLWKGANLTAMLLGVFNGFWYNFVYTPLKRRTAFAFIPGALVGAIPPMMGWVAGGGDITSPAIALLAFFFFIWQIPHFWIILIKYGKEYAMAGMPSVTNLFSLTQLRSLTFVWLMASGVATLFIPAFSLVDGLLFKLLIVLADLAYLVVGFYALYKTNHETINYKLAFINVNLFLITIMVLLMVQNTWR